MSSLARVREVYERVVDLEGPDRERVLREVCGADGALRSEVEALLRAGQDAQSFMENPPSAVSLEELAAIASTDSGTFRKGEKFGAFTLLEPLGQGGMGVVYMAEQDRPRRTVALKLIRSPFLSPQLLRRFEQEAQVLGLLRHPGIAQIYEAGSAPGPDGRVQPYYAMELVRGKPLIAFANERGLGVRDRLQLFSLICDAVQHAHQKGVIHRDLKPANILVEDAEATTGRSFAGTTSTTSGPQPKILDFGVARITGSDIAVTTAGTDVGQLVGTIPYMSPEQVRGDVHGIDTRSDVYALGVVLFELLTGRLPYDVKGKTIAAAAMTITNEEPTSPGRIIASLRGDIETIVLKALEKAPERRYQSAAELASDVRRHLADLPIIARPATTAYQFRKFARRNKALVGGIIAAFVLLTAGVVGTSIGLVRARSAQRLAEQRESEARIAARTAENSEQFLISMLSAANPAVSRNREMTVRELLDEAALKVDAQLAEEPAVAFRTRLALARTYLSIGAFDQAQAQIDAGDALAVRLYGDVSVEHSLVLSVLCEYYQSRSMITEALPVAQRSLDIRAALLPPDDILVARAEYALGRLQVSAGKYSEGLPRIRTALGIMEKHGGVDAITYASELASTLRRTRKAEDAKEADALLESTLQRARALGPKGGAVTSAVLLNVASLHERRGDPKKSKEMVLEAIQLREAFYPPNHPNILYARLALVRSLRANDEPAEARAQSDALLEPLRRVMGPDAAILSDVLRERAHACMESHDLDCALASIRQAVDMLHDKTPFVFQSTTLTILAEVHMARNEWNDALVACDRALDTARARKVPLSMMHVTAQYRAKCLLKLGRGEEALAAVDENLAGLPVVDETLAARMEVSAFKAEILDSLGRATEGQALLRSVIDQVHNAGDADWTAELLEQLAKSCDEAGDSAGAAQARERAHSLAKPAGEP
ncbi:MAG TPA: protein kinase [Phycisphaerales bacterium]|nr:protein kinase [Phycisphaerales bacterium]